MNLEKRKIIFKEHNMYIYKVGYDSYEESPQIILLHNTKFTQEQFEKMILDELPAIIEQEKKQEYCCLHSFSDIYDEVVKMLIKKYEFKEAKFDAQFMPFGWASMFVADDWINVRGDLLCKITTTLNDAGFGLQDDSILSEEEECRKKHEKKTD